MDDLRAWMATTDVEAAYVTRPVSIEYLTGVHAEPYERLMASAVKGDRATLIVPAIEVENAERTKTSADIVSWRDGEDPYRLVHRALHGTSRLGVEKEHLTVAAAEALRERLGSHDLVDVAPEIRRLRRTKSPPELEMLHRAAVITHHPTPQLLECIHEANTAL